MAGETQIQKVGTHNPSIWDFFGNLKRKIDVQNDIFSPAHLAYGVCTQRPCCEY